MRVEEAYDNFVFGVRDPKTGFPYSTVLLYTQDPDEKLRVMEVVFQAGWNARYASLTTKDI